MFEILSSNFEKAKHGIKIRTNKTKSNGTIFNNNELEIKYIELAQKQLLFYPKVVMAVCLVHDTLRENQRDCNIHILIDNVILSLCIVLAAYMKTVYLETPYIKYCIYMCVRDIDFDCFCDILLDFDCFCDILLDFGTVSVIFFYWILTVSVIFLLDFDCFCDIFIGF